TKSRAAVVVDHGPLAGRPWPTSLDRRARPRGSGERRSAPPLPRARPARLPDRATGRPTRSRRCAVRGSGLSRVRAVVPTGGHAPVLVSAQQGARASDLEALHGDPEARAELGSFEDGAQPLFGCLGERGIPRVQEIGIGAVGAASDAAPKLVKLRQAKALRL